MGGPPGGTKGRRGIVAGVEARNKIMVVVVIAVTVAIWQKLSMTIVV